MVDTEKTFYVFYPLASHNSSRNLIKHNLLYMCQGINYHEYCYILRGVATRGVSFVQQAKCNINVNPILLGTFFKSETDEQIVYHQCRMYQFQIHLLLFYHNVGQQHGTINIYTRYKSLLRVADTICSKLGCQLSIVRDSIELHYSVPYIIIELAINFCLMIIWLYQLFCYICIFWIPICNFPIKLLRKLSGFFLLLSIWIH